MEGQLSKADESLLELFVSLLGSPDFLQVAKAFRDAYSGPLQTIATRIAQESYGDAKAVARKLQWDALLETMLVADLERALAARNLEDVLAVSAEIKDVLGSLPPDVEPGLAMHEFDCPHRENLPDFSGMEPTRKRAVKQISFSVGQPRIERDAALFRGHLEIRSAGLYKLWTESLDGSRLWLDGKLVVDNDGRRHGHHGHHFGVVHGHHWGPPGAQEREGSATLEEGLHALRLEWFAHNHRDHQHAPQLLLRYSGPDSNESKVVVPEKALCHMAEDLGNSDGSVRARVRQFLCEMFAAGNSQDVIVSALPLYSAGFGELLQQASRQLLARLATQLFLRPGLFADGGLKAPPACLPSGQQEAASDLLMHAFVEVAQQSIHVGGSLTHHLKTLQTFYRGPASAIVWFLLSRWPLEQRPDAWQGMREAANTLQWTELSSGLKFLDPPSCGSRSSSEVCPGLPSPEPLLEEYVMRGVVDLSSLDIKDEEMLCRVLLRFREARRLFLPSGSDALAARAKSLLPALEVAHLGSALGASELAELESEYASTRELWVPSSLTLPAVLEFAHLFPEPRLVALALPDGPQAAAWLDDHGKDESPVFELGDSVSEFTCVFEFLVHPHQVPGELYQVCAGQWGAGHGDFCLGWSKHWADGRDSIILKREGNQGGGGRIMHGGSCCGFDMSGGLNDGEWHRVAVVYDANDRTCTLHLDGRERSETQRYNVCHPLQLTQVTIGEQGAWTREGRRPDRRFPTGQLRNVRLYDRVLPEEELFCWAGQASSAPAELRELRRRLPGVPILQSAVPQPQLREMLRRYREDGVVSLARCEGLTRQGLGSLMGLFPRPEVLLLQTCGCSQELAVLPGEGDGWSERISCRKKRKTDLEWKDLASVFLSRKLANAFSEARQPNSSGTAALSEILQLSMQLSSLDVEATDEVDKKELGCFLVKHALSDLDEVQLGLLDLAAFYYRDADARTYLSASALAPPLRAVLAKLVLSSEDGLGMLPKTSWGKRLPECSKADTFLLDAFVALLTDKHNKLTLKQQLQRLRPLYRGPIQDLVDAFTGPVDTEEWPVLRDTAREIGWNEIAEAFSRALLRPQTVKMKVKRQQLVTDEVLEAYKVPPGGAAARCEVCAGEAELRLSTECSHYFCGECAGRSLRAIKDAGQFPGYCPGCRAESAMEGLPEPPVGRVQTPALAVLEGRGVITWDFQLQFLRQHAKDPEEYFRCPGKCREYLVACSPQYMCVAKGEHEHEGFRRIMRLGECPCGATMCVRCHELVATGRHGQHEHQCKEEKPAEDPHEEESVRAMEQLGKRCPNCGIFLEKNGMCDIMMCGTEAHGQLEKALANGGCGYQFYWETGEPAQSHYVGLNGEQVNGIVSRRG